MEVGPPLSKFEPFSLSTEGSPISQIDTPFKIAVGSIAARDDCSIIIVMLEKCMTTKGTE